jgi:hypothetical protein
MSTEMKWDAKRAWSLVYIPVGLACWVIGDGHSLGVNPPIPDWAKLGFVLLGWLYLIDGVRVFFGHGSFMKYVYRYGFYLLAITAAVAASATAVWWLYDTLSLKAMVAIGLTAAIALLVFILRELRKRN